ncbi:phosphoribosylglycinamide formyltransferase [Bdellovibrio bacteriovorus]|uniref:phosphoribosylglycinamide formyltransferase n=1 Tax=Bdellovibrio bacteriovorus TaxID=959 RepID=UPI003AA90478
MNKIRIAILASGTGSNAEALMKKAQSLNSVEVTFVLSDKAGAGVLEKAQNLSVRHFVVAKQNDRREHEQRVLNLLREYRIDWVFLAGYMRLLSPEFLQTFSAWHRGSSQVVNIHPSLLPAYPGVDSIRRAYEDRVNESGVTLHLVDEGMDTGPHLMQSRLTLEAGESLADWSVRFHKLEHQTYTQFLELMALGQIPTSPFEET